MKAKSTWCYNKKPTSPPPKKCTIFYSSNKSLCLTSFIVFLCLWVWIFKGFFSTYHVIFFTLKHPLPPPLAYYKKINLRNRPPILPLTSSWDIYMAPNVFFWTTYTLEMSLHTCLIAEVNAWQLMKSLKPSSLCYLQNGKQYSKWKKYQLVNSFLDHPLFFFHVNMDENVIYMSTL